MKLIQIKTNKSKYASVPCIECGQRSKPGQWIYHKFMPHAETNHRDVIIHARHLTAMAAKAPLDATADAAREELERKRQLILTTGDPYVH